MLSYSTPSHLQHFELTVKRSRFITSIHHVCSAAEAKQFITLIKTQHPDASHHCWASITGRPDESHGVDQSDDGEPKGTAGKPMLNVLQHNNVGNIIVVVSRYFGGIKLGAGGLVRAYSGSVSEALTHLQTREQFILQNITIQLPYSLFPKLEYLLAQHGVKILNKQFDKEVTLEIGVAKNALDAFCETLLDSGNGQIKIISPTKMSK